MYVELKKGNTTYRARVSMMKFLDWDVDDVDFDDLLLFLMNNDDDDDDDDDDLKQYFTVQTQIHRR